MKHICGLCKKGFDEEVDYLDHVCDKVGHKPTEPEFLGEGFEAISKAALERGTKRAELEKEGKSAKEAVKETREIGKVIK